MILKDKIKETMFDASGVDVRQITRSHSHQLGVQSDAVMYALATGLLSARVSCIIEANFLPTNAAHDLAPLVSIANARQVHCHVPAPVSINRYRTRYESGMRHPVHLDHLEAEDRVSDPIQERDLLPIPLDCPLLSIDTESGYRPALDRILDFCTSDGRRHIHDQCPEG